MNKLDEIVFECINKSIEKYGINVDNGLQIALVAN